MIATRSRIPALAQESPVDPWAGWAVAAGLLLAVLCLSTVRIVGRGERLVLLRSGRVTAVHGRGLAAVLPGVHLAVRVSLAPARVDLFWLDAVTRDGVAVTVNATVVLTVRDAAAYALAPGSPEAVAETEIRGYLAERDLAELSRSTVDDRRLLAARISDRTLAWGVEFDGLEFSRMDVGLLRSPDKPRPSTVDFARTTVPGTGTLHHCVTRGGRHVGVLLDHGERRRLLVYGSTDPDVPAQTIVLERDEADQVADLLHSRPVADRLAALERRLAGEAR